MVLAFVQWLGQNAFQYVLGADASTDHVDGFHELVDLQCGRTVFNGVPAQMRAELWLSQMHRDRQAVQACEEFTHLVSRNLPPDVQSEIEKDLHRTYPGHWRLSTAQGQRALFRVLKAYAVADPTIGYTQGMNFVAGLILSYVPSEAGAFGVFWLVMHGRGLRDCYKPDMSMLQVRLWQMGKLLPPGLAAHLEQQSVLPVLYASSWFLTCFASDFPLPFAARIMDLVITDCYAAPIMKVALAVMRAAAPLLAEVSDIEVAVEYLKKDVPRWPLERLQEMLTAGLARPWTPRQLAVLRELNGAETVDQAVRRVGGGGKAREAQPAPSPSGTADGALLSAPSTADGSPVDAEGQGVGPAPAAGAPPGTARPELRALQTAAAAPIPETMAADVEMDGNLSKELAAYAASLAGAAEAEAGTADKPTARPAPTSAPQPASKAAPTLQTPDSPGSSSSEWSANLSGLFRLPPPPSSPFFSGRATTRHQAPASPLPLGAAGSAPPPPPPPLLGDDLACETFGSWKASVESGELDVAAQPVSLRPGHPVQSLDDLLDSGWSLRLDSRTSLI